jgi:hypothetical protein
MEISYSNARIKEIAPREFETKPELICRNAYEQKEALKALGFRWDANQKAWEKMFNDFSEVGDAFVDVVVDCNLPYDDVEDFFSRTDNAIVEAFSFSDSKLDKYNAYMEEQI